MSKKTFTNASADVLADLEQLNDKIAKMTMQEQKRMIEESSPFSPDITKAFSGYEEYHYLLSLGLREALVTRKSLIKDIDPNLYITEKQRTNYELMHQGLSPYTKNSKDCYIILHHIGQGFDAPFAELTAEEHARFGNSKLLHKSDEESWRREPEKDQAFMSERAAYWKKRAKGDITLLSGIITKETEQMQLPEKKDLSADIKRALETLFGQCTAEDLRFISGLAQTHLTAQEIGATSLEEFAASYRAEKGEAIKCPMCDSTNIALYGTYKTSKERKQKYRCGECGKVFSTLYNAVVQGCSFSLFEWIRFIDCLYNGFSIKKTATLCGISEKTAFDNRLRLFYALLLLEEEVQLEGNIGIDETYFSFSFKGNRELQKDFKKPRDPRRRGSENHIPGLSKEKVAVACAVDEYGTAIAVVTGYGNPSAGQLDEALRAYINPERIKMLHSDGSPAIKRFAKINNFPIQQTNAQTIQRANAKRRDTVRHIQRVNSFHSRLKKFIERYNGISSEQLQGYVSLFAWKERNRDREPYEAYRELLGALISPTIYSNPIELIEALQEKIGSGLPDNVKLHFRNKASEEKTKKIYALYADGVPVKEIAEQFQCSTQAITRRIRNLRSWGLAYKTKKDILKEESAERKRMADYFKIEKIKERGKYLDALLAEKESWEGSLESFYNTAEEKYGKCRQTIKNDIAQAKRVAALREPFSFWDLYDYKDSDGVYTEIFERYTELRQAEPKLQQKEIVRRLSLEFEYSASTLQFMVFLFKRGDKFAQGETKRVPISQTLNRDRSVFVDILKWQGSYKEFLQMASCKYQLCESEIQSILRFHYIAEPRRYDMSKLD